MKKVKFLTGAILAAGIAFFSCQGNKKSDVKLTNEADSVSYALGINTGSGYADNLKDFPGDVKINKDILIEGFIKGIKEDSANYQFKEKDIMPYLRNFFDKVSKKEKEKAEIENAKILAANKAKDSVQVTASGLQYKIITEGKGKKPTEKDFVRVNYTGKLANGTIFDSSAQRGEPATFPVNAVVPGWSEALQMMPVGSKWELAIPSELGYGERQIGEIPANSVLFFEVELLDIVKNPNSQAQGK